MSAAAPKCVWRSCRWHIDAQRGAERLLVVEGDARANNPDRLS
jgi:hypothetical protein